MHGIIVILKLKLKQWKNSRQPVERKKLRLPYQVFWPRTQAIKILKSSTGP